MSEENLPVLLNSSMYSILLLSTYFLASKYSNPDFCVTSTKIKNRIKRWEQTIFVKLWVARIVFSLATEVLSRSRITEISYFQDLKSDPVYYNPGF